MSCLKAQDQDLWLLQTDPSNEKATGYMDQDNNVTVPFGKYRICFTDTFRTFAFVLDDSAGFAFIDRNDSILFRVFPYDNGPDYLSEGTFRIISGNKVGIADTLGNTIIKPEYDFIYPLNNGLAVVNIGGENMPADPDDPYCEHFIWSGGKWGVLDRFDSVLLDIKYDLRFDAENRNEILYNENERYLIKDGKVIPLK